MKMLVFLFWPACIVRALILSPLSSVRSCPRSVSEYMSVKTSAAFNPVLANHSVGGRHVLCCTSELAV